MQRILLVLFLFFPLVLSSNEVLINQENPSSKDLGEKKVLIAILARNKAHVLPLYLHCIENLDYDKKLITVYINTNNNVDKTVEILENWAAKHAQDYAAIVFEKHEADIPHANPHEWNGQRVKLLGEIRNTSLRQTKKHQCDYYFVVDCDNFIIPETLKTLIAKDKPIIAPLLRSIPHWGDGYSNFHCAVSDYGFWEGHPDYNPILCREKIGTFKVPLVHCTYLIKAECIDDLSYTDCTNQYEYIIFSRNARLSHVDQYICNEKDFGVLVHFTGEVDPNTWTAQDEGRALKAFFDDYLRLARLGIFTNESEINALTQR